MLDMRDEYTMVVMDEADRNPDFRSGWDRLDNECREDWLDMLADGAVSFSDLLESVEC